MTVDQAPRRGVAQLVTSAREEPQVERL
ncbi:hypothetical protein RRG08_056918, partial [Elysia crispata]